MTPSTRSSSVASLRTVSPATWVRSEWDVYPPRRVIDPANQIDRRMDVAIGGGKILRVAEHHEGGIPEFKEAEPRVQDAIYMDRIQPALRAYLTKLREDAFIDVRPGYVDSGASANQTKPVETTTKEANAKNLKKKRKKKQRTARHQARWMTRPASPSPSTT